MADLDTRSKRASSVGILLVGILAPVLPDGAIGQGDRQHIAWSYSGILAAAVQNPLGVVASWRGSTRSVSSMDGSSKAVRSWTGTSRSTHSFDGSE